MAIGWFWWLAAKKPGKSPLSREFYRVLGGLMAMIALTYGCKEVGFGANRAGFLAAAGIALLVLAVAYRSLALWAWGLLAMTVWWGAFSDLYAVRNLFLGMNWPTRYALWGLLLLAIATAQRRANAVRFSASSTSVLGLGMALLGFWGMSVFGNYGDLEAWAKVRQTQVIGYGILFAVAAAASLWYGIRHNEELARDAGLVGLLVNLYTRYFEYFWDAMNKGLFFLFLAVSFWLLGRWIEREKRNHRFFFRRSSRGNSLG
jgi:hypothetical protein